MTAKPSTCSVRLYERLWTAAEIKADRDMIHSLNTQATLFRVSARASEQVLHTGPLSIKTVRWGKTVYRFGNQSITVHPGQMLLVPDAARYTTHIGLDGAQVVTLYFPRRLVADAVAAISLPAERLLDGASVDSRSMAGFAPHLRKPDGDVCRLLDSLARSKSPERLSDLTMDALEMTVRLALEAVKAVSRVPATRDSVKRELFRRASLARDQIEDSLPRDIPLTDLANTACLSAFHLHRVFKSAFRETPADMVRRRRVERASELLLSSNRPVSEIARAVGFVSESSFSRRFRAATGFSPSVFRENART
jgi:AraC-like DNA-binding protein